MSDLSFNLASHLWKNLLSITAGIIVSISIISFSCFAQESPQTGISDNIFKNTLVRMTWQEVKAAADKKAIVLVPISVVEEHGPHLDLSSDILITSHICSVMKETLEKDSIPTVIAPPYYWGINISTGLFPGSFNLKTTTMQLVLTEIITNMKKWGFDRFYLVNCHGDPIQISTISTIASSINSSGVAKVNDVSTLPAPPNLPIIPSQTPGMYSPDYHAGANETKIVWALEPSIIRTETAGKLKPQNNFSPLGYVGDPANFMNSKSDQIFDSSAIYNAKAIEYHLSSIAGGVHKTESTLPGKFELLQNYPNPFNPETVISYQIAKISKVELKVYDLLGKEIETLVNKEQNAGKYEVKFNANNLPSGTYFVKFTAGNSIETKKMMLVK